MRACMGTARCGAPSTSFRERFFAWTPYLHSELPGVTEEDEARLIERGELAATGFRYVGERVDAAVA